MPKILAAVFFIAVLSGCGPRYIDYFPYDDEGRPKPSVALIPVRDATNCGVPWSVAEEITEALRCEIRGSGALYLLSPAEMESVLASSQNLDFFGSDLSYANYFCNTDYVVAMELIEHGVVPYDARCNIAYANCGVPSSMVLMVKIRVKILDVRCPVPRIVLHEIFTSNHVIPVPKEEIDYSANSWRSPEFSKTPLGIAHKKVIQDLANRIEEIVHR